ncbi:monovalent cation/H(+) antiporter subunit G [Litoreibacter roseus]|uniref:Na+/H+ antiporter subunit G n=1 Tax=Litoreibacter roseus TaxID=2601869 RepID=A0A6N6JFV3_9RHOB|nr:monovalent cation/H(+) antiporter subunit G [Litoreibacter roseus]GFE64168.1 Na+/H+ antiporter subunit G [Litoreibacter roseus]
MIDVIVGLFLLLGGLFAIIASVGLLRLPDILIRMHASTKVGTLSTGLIMLGVAIHFAEGPIILRVVAIVVFLLLTAPIAGHMIGRAALRTGVPMWRRPDDMVAEPETVRSTPQEATSKDGHDIS